jgi:hypothetical protein
VESVHDQLLLSQPAPLVLMSAIPVGLQKRQKLDHPLTSERFRTLCEYIRVSLVTEMMQW